MSQSETNPAQQEDSLKQFQDYIAQNYPPLTSKINLGSQYQRPVGPRGINVLLHYLNWNIEHLNITMHRVTDEGLQAIILHQCQQQTDGWTNLKEIASIRNMITSEGMKGFDKLSWVNLENFIFSHNKIDHLGVQILTRGNFINLKRLILSHNNVGTLGCEVLSKSNWPTFQRLDLNYNCVKNAGVAYLALANWPNLLQINLSSNKIDSEGMVYLHKANWPNLENLQLSRNLIGFINESQLTDMGCLQISKMKTRHLKTFGFYGNQISINGIRMILRSPLFVENCFLELTKNLFTYAEIKPLLTEFHLFCNEFFSQY